jgi:hypothetical protein
LDKPDAPVAWPHHFQRHHADAGSLCDLQRTKARRLDEAGPVAECGNQCHAHQDHHDGEHLQISVRTEPMAGDDAQAAVVLAGARAAMVRFRDVQAAERDGYKAYITQGQIGEEVHYTHFWRAGSEKTRIDPERPSSLLYRRTADGMKIVGVMYTAKPDAAPEELNRRVPLSIGTWHRHVHFCGWPSDAPRKDYEGPAPRFGFYGSIADEATCKAARGYWIPVAFGWMTHVYPEGKTHEDRWFGRQMIAAEAGLPSGYNCMSTASEEP